MTITLSGLRDRVETILADAANIKWATTQLDEAIREALSRYNLSLPRVITTTLTLDSDGRRIDLSSLTYHHITRVEFPYDASDPAYPPNVVAFDMWSATELLVYNCAEPQTGQVLRLWYTTDHTLDGLDSATETTFDEGHATLMVRGAAAYAVTNRLVELAEMATVGKRTGQELNSWGLSRRMAFGNTLRRIARKNAATESGVAPVNSLDRWDARGEG